MQSPGSQASISSRHSRRSYRSRESSVDESLFGTKRGGKKAVAFGEVARVRNPDVVVLSKNEFLSLTKAATIVTPEEQRKRDATTALTREEKMRAAKARKARMLELEEKRVKHRELSDLEKEAKYKAQHLLVEAERKRVSQLDEVKHMATLANLAEVMTIRDLQLEEKREAKDRELQIDEKMLVVAEEVRLKAIEDEEASIKMREEADKKAFAVLRMQIEERERARRMEAEIQQQEAQALKEHIDRLKEEDKELARRRIEQGHKMLEEVVETNRAVLERKKLEKLKEREEDDRITQYLQEKAEREAHLEKEAEEQRKARELEIARLRAEQEKAMDKAAEKDAVAARQEAKERRYRAEALAKAEKKQRTQVEMAEARETQLREKAELKRLHQEQDRVEFVAMMKRRDEVVELEKRKDLSVARQRMLVRDALLEQIEEKETASRSVAIGRVRDGPAEFQRAEAERIDTLTQARDEKLKQLRASGVAEKYCVELKGLKF